MIGIIGCGNMGKAILSGVKRACKGEKVSVYDKDRRKLQQAIQRYKAEKAASLDSLISKARILLIAVKPQDIGPVLEALKKDYRNKLIISIAAGITTSYIERYTGKGVRVVRVMPNLPAKVSSAVSGLSKGKNALKSDVVKAKKIFNALGQTIEISEKYIDALTAVSGSGPGYIYYFIYCLQEAARGLGFSKREAKRLAVATFKGAAKLLSEKDDLLGLVSKVSSKGGTTEAALNELKRKRFKATVKLAVRKAKEKANKLSK